MWFYDKTVTVKATKLWTCVAQTISSVGYVMKKKNKSHSNLWQQTFFPPTPPIKRATLRKAVHLKIFVCKFQAPEFSFVLIWWFLGEVYLLRVLVGKNYVWSCKVVTRFCNAKTTSGSSQSVVSWLVETLLICLLSLWFYLASDWWLHNWHVKIILFTTFWLLQ